MNGINFVQTGETLYLSIGNEVERANLDQNTLQQVFEHSGSAACLLDDNAFGNALSAIAAEDTSLIRIGQCLPATIRLEVSDDDMQVHAVSTAPFGGTPLSLNQILKMLRESGVTMGIRRQAMEKVIDHSLHGEPGSELEVLIARGRTAIDGDDARFEPLTQDARERVLRPQVKNENEKVDMRDLGEVISVQPGTKLLRRVPPTQGNPGFTVKGFALEATPGKNRDLQAGNGAVVSPEDTNVLIAANQGLPRILDNAAHIDDVLTMRKVDATTGHVNYEGSVLINGNVGPGMKVTAGGDVTVTGYVDSAVIEAAGNITVTKGVIGQQSEQVHDDDAEHAPSVEHSTRVTAGGSLWVSYSQYATLKANKGVIVDKQLTHCHVITQGTLCLGGEGKEARGKLIGGVIDTTTHVYAGQIGAPAGTKTYINIASPTAHESYLADTERLSKGLRDEMAMVKKLSKARQRAREEDMPSAKLKKFLQPLEQKLENHRRNITVLKIQFKELQKRAPERQMIIVHANRVLYSGVVLQGEYESKRIDENRGPSTLILKNGSFSYQYVG